MAKKSLTKTVQLGGLSVGETTCRLGFHFNRDEIGIEDADALFSGSRCTVTLEKRDEAQQSLTVAGKKIDEIKPIEAVCDIKGFRTTVETFSAGMTFQTSEVDISHLAKFSGKEVKMSLKRTGDIPKESPAVDEGDDDDDDQDKLPLGKADEEFENEPAPTGRRR